MNEKLNSLLKKLKYDKVSMVYSYNFENIDQEDEIRLRENFANDNYQDYFETIAGCHSISVMDTEVVRFINALPCGGVIIDVGGGWGWHWRRLSSIRPDLSVVVVDFCKNNFTHAKNILKNEINKTVFLVHGDATNLIFDKNIFDGYWTVQALQHIPSFHKCIEEAFRVLKPGGIFANYSLNNQYPIKLLYSLFRKDYVSEGYVNGLFYLSRASKKQAFIIEIIFNSKVKKRYTEILFKPELGLSKFGRVGFWGNIDSKLSNIGFLFSSIARQCSFHVIKRNKDSI
jgi:ubiquinone/menaquinone biosynthesis C-methylase UbiE